MSNLSDNQLILLDNLIYYVSNEPNNQIHLENGKSIESIVNDSIRALDQYGEEYPCAMDRAEWEQLLDVIVEDKELCSYTIQNYEKDSDKRSDTYNFCAMTVVSADKSDVNVIFRGTNGDLSEWTDNGAGGYSTDTAYQQKAANYIDNLPPECGDHMTVSGHSKGGNLSMYTAIMSNRVERCVAIDGQGFSEEFARKYTAQIGMNRDKITLISAEYDFVNPLLYTIAGTCRFIETEELKKKSGYHKPNILLDNNGKIRKEVSESWVTSFVQNFTTYANSCIPDPQRKNVIDDLTSLLAKDKFVLGKAVNLIEGACGLVSYLPGYFIWKNNKDAAENQQAQFLEDHDFENEDAIKEYLREHTGDEKPQYLVRGALLRCRHGTHARRLNLLLDHAVYVRGCPMIHEFNCETVDEKNIPWFGVCQSPCPPSNNIVRLTADSPRDSSGEPISEAEGTVEGRKCEPFIVSYQWKDTYPKTRIIDNGELNQKDRIAAETDGSGKGEASVTTLSFLVCNWGGLIEPYTSGQELAEQEDESGQENCNSCSQSSTPHTH